MEKKLPGDLTLIEVKLKHREKHLAASYSRIRLFLTGNEKALRPAVMSRGTVGIWEFTLSPW